MITLIVVAGVTMASATLVALAPVSSRYRGTHRKDRGGWEW